MGMWCSRCLATVGPDVCVLVPRYLGACLAMLAPTRSNGGLSTHACVLLRAAVGAALAIAATASAWEPPDVLTGSVANTKV